MQDYQVNLHFCVVTSQHNWLLPTLESGEARQLRRKRQELTKQQEMHIMVEMWPDEGKFQKWNRDTSSIIIHFSFSYYFCIFCLFCMSCTLKKESNPDWNHYGQQSYRMSWQLVKSDSWPFAEIFFNCYFKSPPLLINRGKKHSEVVSEFCTRDGPNSLIPLLLLLAYSWGTWVIPS